MGNIAETIVFEEMLAREIEEEAFQEFVIENHETELIHEVNGVTVCEQLEDVLQREQLEMEAELGVGI